MYGCVEELRVGMGNVCVSLCDDFVCERSGFRIEVVPIVFILPFEWECGCESGSVEERAMVSEYQNK